ncbi:MAG: IS1634 family transposase, partial [Sciscionella sp.]
MAGSLAGMYLRETSRRNRDGSVVRYLQLAHNERNPDTGVPTAKVIHNFGRVSSIDRAALSRLVSSISRFLDPALAVAAAGGAELQVLDSRRLGGVWVLERIWERLGIGSALHRAASGRKLDADTVERVIFALVAQRALEPGSKLAACRWTAERVAIEGLAGLDTDAAYAGMDFLLAALPQIAAGIFDTTATLLNLQCDVVFVDTTSTYWELDGADDLADLAEDAADDGVRGPVEAATRTWGHSKDHRPDLPQVVIGMAVTAEG